MELSRHANDHVIEVRVEMLAFGNVHAFGRRVVVARKNVVNVVDASWPETDLGEVRRPHSSIGVLGLLL